MSVMDEGDDGKSKTAEETTAVAGEDSKLPAKSAKGVVSETNDGNDGSSKKEDGRKAGRKRKIDEEQLEGDRDSDGGQLFKTPAKERGGRKTQKKKVDSVRKPLDRSAKKKSPK